ncbi:hypothetical protein [Bradyrhizobium sp. USDA 4472]
MAASKAVEASPGHEAHNVLIDIEDPLAETDADREAIKLVDKFLIENTETGYPVRTVANTIFPQSLYEDHGAPTFYDIYLKKVFPRLKRNPQDWGRYFERMIAYPVVDDVDNLLERLILKMKRNVDNGRPFRNIYELPIYNPVKDAEGRPRGGQCLSYLSFKLDGEQRLLLTAVYRNHFYTEKLLGNLIGLGWLMRYVAERVGVAVGSLSILSTHAQVDKGKSTTPRGKVHGLHSECATLLADEMEDA